VDLMAEPSAFVSSEDTLARAVNLRDAAVRLLRHRGNWLEIENYPGKVRSYDDDHLFILYRTPFTPPPISAEAEAAGIDAAAQRQAAREYGLDIWRESRKVISLIWNEGKAPAVVLHKAGPWEDELKALCAACDAN
jgi:hypothetical protein